MSTVEVIHRYPIRRHPKPLTSELLEQIPLDLQGECIQLLGIKHRDVYLLHEPYLTIERIYALIDRLSGHANHDLFVPIRSRLLQEANWIIDYFNYESLKIDPAGLSEEIKGNLTTTLMRQFHTQSILDLIIALRSISTQTIRLLPVLNPQSPLYECYRVQDLLQILQAESPPLES